MVTAMYKLQLWMEFLICYVYLMYHWASSNVLLLFCVCKECLALFRSLTLHLSCPMRLVLLLLTSQAKIFIRCQVLYQCLFHCIFHFSICVMTCSTQSSIMCEQLFRG